MSNRDRIDLAARGTLEYLDPGKAQDIFVHGIKIIGVDRDIYHRITYFEFENGWVVEINVDKHYGRGGPAAVYRELVSKIEAYLKFLDPMILEAFRAPEVLTDESPDELDPFPVFVCDCCRSDYEQ